MANQVVTFGEIMMRLSTPGFARFIQSECFNATYGGGEANVAVSLAQLGVSAAHITRFPDNELGHAATNLLRKYKVDTQHIVYGGDRLGLYFLENGSSVRASKVIYDRSNSSFADLQPDMIDWEEALDGASWFHWTGITPAISEGAAESCRKAIEVANRRGITVSADINYRKNLWQYGKKASEVMPELIAGCNLIVSGKSDAKDILHITSDKPDDESYVDIFNQIMQRFPKVKKIVNTTRGSVSCSHNTLSGMLYDGERLLSTTTYEITPIVDRIGGGDAFMAGLIYGLLKYEDDQKALDFGVAASVLKHTIQQDVNLATVEEVEVLLTGDTSGRLKR